MSIPVPRTIMCPSCGKPIQFTMWESINTDMEFAAPDIISGKLFDIECGSCGLKTRVDYPILFNDIVHSMMVYYLPSGDVQEAEKDRERISTYGMALRIVTSQNDLMEKVRILNDGLDDRIVELLKALMLPQLRERLQGKAIKRIFYLGKDGGYSFELHCNDEITAATLPSEAYDYVKEQFLAHLTNADSCYINQDWAAGILNDT